MARLEKALDVISPQNETRRLVRANRLIARLPIEMGASILSLRRQRISLGKQFVAAVQLGDVKMSCQISDAITRVVAETRQLYVMGERLSRRGRRGWTPMPEPIDIEPIDIDLAPRSQARGTDQSSDLPLSGNSEAEGEVDGKQ